MGKVSFLSRFGIEELKELDNYIQKKVEEHTSKRAKSNLPTCSQCGAEITTEICDEEGLKRFCNACNTTTLVYKYAKEVREPKPSLPMCVECRSEPSTVTVYSERVNGARVCSGCANLQKYSGR